MKELLSRVIATARTPNDLVAALYRQMLDEEARLAATLSTDASALRAAPEPLEDALLPLNGAGGARW